MTQNLISAIIEMETNPPYGFSVGMHNIYLPIVAQLGQDKVQYVEDRFIGGNDFDSRTEIC